MISLIIECCKTDQNTTNIKKFISDIHNWKEFINLAFSHGVFPLVYHTLKTHDNRIPNNILKSMKTYNRSIAQQNMLMSAELIKVMKLLKENNIEAIAFKGPTLAQMAYGDIALRQYADLDILIQKDDVYKVYELFKNNYTRSLQRSENQEDIWFKYAHDLGLTGANGIHIEFHWRMLDSDHPINLNDIDFYSSIQTTTFKQNSMKIISNEEFLIYLCVHGSKHMFERIEWVADIDRFIRIQNIDWDKFTNLLQNKNYQKFVYLGLTLAHKLFSTPLINAHIYSTKDINTVNQHIFNLWNQRLSFNNKNNMKYMLKLFNSNFDKVAYMHKIYLKPTFTEYWYINLPKSLYFLYYPIRQYLLLKKYFLDKSK